MIFDLKIGFLVKNCEYVPNFVKNAPRGAEKIRNNFLKCGFPNFWPLDAGICYFWPEFRILRKNSAIGSNSIQVKEWGKCAKKIIVVNVCWFSKKNVVKRISFSEVFEGLGRFKKVREACRNNFHLFSSKSELMVPSYDQRNNSCNVSKSNDY